MSGFVLHPGAFADLDEIWEFIAADNVMAADRVLEEILEAIRSLVSFPRMGHSRLELTSHPLRFHPVRDFGKAGPGPGRTPRPPQSSRYRRPSARQRIVMRLAFTTRSPRRHH